MITAKLGRIASRAALALALVVSIGAVSVTSAHADWHGGHWGWRGGVRVWIANPYPYAYPYGYYPNSYYNAYYPYGYGYYAPPAPVYAPPVVVGPSFGFFFGGRRHW